MGKRKGKAEPKEENGRNGHLLGLIGVLELAEAHLVLHSGDELLSTLRLVEAEARCLHRHLKVRPFCHIQLRVRRERDGYGGWGRGPWRGSESSQGQEQKDAGGPSQGKAVASQLASL